MKKFLTFLCLLFPLSAVANIDSTLIRENSIQARINNVGTKILNSNKFEYK